MRRLTEAFIHVRTEGPLLVQGADGGLIRIEGTTPSMYLPVPVAAYRLNAWMGLFFRHLVRVRGFGREYWLDWFWARENRGVAPVPVSRPTSRQSGCGCGGRKA